MLISESGLGSYININSFIICFYLNMYHISLEIVVGDGLELAIKYLTMLKSKPMLSGRGVCWIQGLVS